MTQTTFRCDKLARDHDPQLMNARGIHTTTRLMNPEEHEHFLIKKIIEEAQEVQEYAPHNREKALDELKDVQEAVMALLTHWGIAFDGFQTQRQAKAHARGGYGEGVYLDSVTLASDHPEYNHYAQRPGKYPKV